MSFSAVPRLALVGDRGNHGEPAHPRIDALLAGLGVQARWLPTDRITNESDLRGFDGIWVVPGAPYRSERGVQCAVRHARGARVPFLGTCGGFFSALIGNAVLQGLPEVAGVVEDPDEYQALTNPLTCSVGGLRAPLIIRAESRLARIYGGIEGVKEVFHCSWALSSEFMEAAVRGDMEFSAWDESGNPRALELHGHPFFMASLFQPELSSTPEAVHPIITGFLAAANETAGLTLVGGSR